MHKPFEQAIHGLFHAPWARESLDTLLRCGGCGRAGRRSISEALLLLLSRPLPPPPRMYTCTCALAAPLHVTVHHAVQRAWASRIRILQIISIRDEKRTHFFVLDLFSFLVFAIVAASGI
jgi:hypothetical protein